MSEYPNAKPDTAEEVQFATAAAAADVVKPSAGTISAGWAEGAELPHENHNWQQKALGDNSYWLQAIAVRQFTSVPDAIQNTDPGGLFSVSAGGGYIDNSGTVTDETIPTGGSTIDACTDGAYLYRVDDDETLQCYVIDDDNLVGTGTTRTGWATAGTSLPGVPTKVETDGYYVVVGFEAPAGSGTLVAVYLCSDGSLYSSVSGLSTFDVASVSTNGDAVAWALGTSVEIRDIDMTNSRSYSHGTTVYDVAINHQFCYVAGVINSASDTAVILVQDTAALYAGSDLAAGEPMRAVATDGRFVYFAGGTTNGKIYGVCRWACHVVWSLTAATAFPGAELDRIACDQNSVYVCENADSPGNVWRLARETGSITDRWTTSDNISHAWGLYPDGYGLRLMLNDGSAVASTAYQFVNRHSVTLRRMNPESTCRHPNNMLALAELAQ